MTKQNNPLKHLKELTLAANMIKAPSMRKELIFVNVWAGIANKETRELRRIESFVNKMGYQCEIIDNKGTYTGGKTERIDPHGGGVNTYGSENYRASKMTNGTADLSATIGGRSTKIELKRVYKSGKDRQSPAQRAYQAHIIKSGGLYIITASFDDFYKRIYWVLIENPFISQDELNKLI